MNAGCKLKSETFTSIEYVWNRLPKAWDLHSSGVLGTVPKTLI